MAYFANGTEGMVFDDQCYRCKYGEQPCPIALAQMEWNYEACNNKTARAILDSLVKNDGTCTMWKQFENDFFKDPNQMKLELGAKPCINRIYCQDCNGFDTACSDYQYHEEDQCSTT